MSWALIILAVVFSLVTAITLFIVPIVVLTSIIMMPKKDKDGQQSV